jgi:parallel beta-helix repeat protein
MAAILLLQPFVAVASYSAQLQPVAETTDDSAALAQEPGSRLEADEYTNHVPIVIDGDSDFTSQGWPGTGSELDPYVIYGLRINYDLGVPLIQIWNTDSYFVIRDCLIDQESFITAVEFVNTTHGTIEYTTVSSGGVGIYCENANNTRVDHVFSDAVLRAAYITVSHSTDIAYGNFSSFDWDAILVELSNYVTISHCKLEAYNSGLDLVNSNNTLCTDTEVFARTTQVGIWSIGNDDATFIRLTVHQSGTAFYSMNCPGITISDSRLNGGSLGLYIWSSYNATVVDSYMEAPTGIGAYLEWCHYAQFSGNEINNTGGLGLLWYGSDNSTINDNTLRQTGTHGIELYLADNVLVANNDVFEAGQVGINATDSHMLNIVDSYIYQAVLGGIYLKRCNDTIIDSNHIDQLSSGYPLVVDDSVNGLITGNAFGNRSGGAGIVLYTARDWVIADNRLQNLYGGVYTDPSLGSTNISVLRNDIEDVVQYFIAIQGTTDSMVINNTGRDSGQWALAYSDNAHGGLAEGNIFEDITSGIWLQADNITVTNNHISDGVNYGILFGSSPDNAEITDNTFSGMADALRLSGGTNTVVRNNIADDCETGAFVNSITSATFENNNFTDCGFYYPKGMTITEYNHTFTGNHVNGKPFYYAINSNGLNLDGDDYGQIMLVNCTNSAISGGVFTNPTVPFLLHLGDNIDVSGIVVHDNAREAYIDRTTNVSIVDSVFEGGEGIRADYAHDFYVDNLTLVDGEKPLRIDNTLGFSVLDSFFQNLTNGGVHAWSSYYGLVEGNDFFSTGAGVIFDDVQDSIVHNNEMKWNLHGIWTWTSTNNNFTFNNVHDNTRGAFHQIPTSLRVTNNTFFANEEWGLKLFSASTVFISGNTLANWGDNGQEDTTTNFWDDGASYGNFWHDFVAPAPYLIPGTGGSSDRYPLVYSPMEPMISEPEDMEYAELSEGNEIRWLLLDDNLRDWEVYVDSQLWAADAWNFDNVTVNIDGLAYGTHEILIVARDLDNNEVNDTVIVTVFDDTDPTISTPNNRVIFLDTTGNEMVWDASDLNPDYFTVERITDGEVQFTQDFSWTGGPITRNLDVLPEGTHTLRMTVYDLDGNSASGSVTVYVVVDSEDPEIDSPEDVEFNEGTLGNFITWSASDAFPSHYVIESNSTVVQTDSWGGTTITLYLDGLTAGYHTFAITVFDMTGNSATDAVNVTVVPPGGFPTLPPPDFTLLVIIAVGAAGAVAIVAVFFLRKRRAEAL